MLSILPVCLLGIVTVWLLWPLVADPINRRRAVRAGSKADGRGDDLFRSLAEHAGPKRQLVRADRG